MQIFFIVIVIRGKFVLKQPTRKIIGVLINTIHYKISHSGTELQKDLMAGQNLKKTCFYISRVKRIKKILNPNQKSNFIFEHNNIWEPN